MIDVVALGELLIDFACTAAGLSTTKSGGISSVPSLATIFNTEKQIGI